jgi:hypothetical protein
MILIIPPEFSMAIQARIPPALYAIHNFIRIHNPDKIHDFEVNDEDVDVEPYGALAPGPSGRQEIARGSARRDVVAQSMWESYQLELQIRGL